MADKDNPSAISKREHEYGDNLGHLIGKFAGAAVEADIIAKKANLEQFLEVIDGPNVEVKGEGSIIGLETKLVEQYSIPRIVLWECSQFLPTSAKLVTDMTISTHQESATHVDSKTNVTAGFGTIFGGVKCSASVGVSHDEKRSTDQRSTIHSELELGRVPAPEGISLIVDRMNRFGDSVSKINESIMAKRVEEMQQEAQEADPADIDAALKEAEPEADNQDSSEDEGQEENDE